MNKAKFYERVRSRLGSLNQDQVNGFEIILQTICGAPLSHQAYMLATAWHETNGTMQPVREAYWLSEDWRRRNLRYYPHYGRGYVQITWDRNYRLADAELHKAGRIKKGELINNLDLALRPDIAAFCLRKGMEDGWYGSKLRNILPMQGVATKQQYMAARKTVNLMDQAEKIEGYAQIFERALRDGGLA
jgi:hypothetical protein